MYCSYHCHHLLLLPYVVKYEYVWVHLLLWVFSFYFSSSFFFFPGFMPPCARQPGLISHLFTVKKSNRRENSPNELVFSVNVCSLPHRLNSPSLPDECHKYNKLPVQLLHSSGEAAWNSFIETPLIIMVSIAGSR